MVGRQLIQSLLADFGDNLIIHKYTAQYYRLGRFFDNIIFYLRRFIIQNDTTSNLVEVVSALTGTELVKHPLITFLFGVNSNWHAA